MQHAYTEKGRPCAPVFAQSCSLVVCWLTHAQIEGNEIESAMLMLHFSISAVSYTELSLLKMHSSLKQHKFP
jgi:predicted membrane protein